MDEYAAYECSIYLTLIKTERYRGCKINYESVILWFSRVWYVYANYVLWFFNEFVKQGNSFVTKFVFYNEIHYMLNPTFDVCSYMCTSMYQKIKFSLNLRGTKTQYHKAQYF